MSAPTNPLAEIDNAARSLLEAVKLSVKAGRITPSQATFALRRASGMFADEAGIQGAASSSQDAQRALTRVAGSVSRI